MKYEQIIEDFDAHINKSGRYTYGDFYIGIGGFIPLLIRSVLLARWKSIT